MNSKQIDGPKDPSSMLQPSETGTPKNPSFSVSKFAEEFIQKALTGNKGGDQSAQDQGAASDPSLYPPAGSLTIPALHTPDSVLPPIAPKPGTAGESDGAPADTGLSPLATDTALQSRIAESFPEKTLDQAIGDILESGWEDAKSASSDLKGAGSGMASKAFDAEDVAGDTKAAGRKVEKLGIETLEAGKRAGDLAALLDGVLGGKVVNGAALAPKVLEDVQDFLGSLDQTSDNLGELGKLISTNSEAGSDGAALLQENLSVLNTIGTTAAGGRDLPAEGPMADVTQSLVGLNLAAADGEVSPGELAEKQDGIQLVMDSARGFGKLQDVLERHSETIGRGIPGGENFSEQLSSGLKNFASATSSAHSMTTDFSMA